MTKANPVCPEDFGPYILSGVLIRLQPLLPAVCMSERCPSENQYYVSQAVERLEEVSVAQM